MYVYINTPINVCIYILYIYIQELVKYVHLYSWEISHDHSQGDIPSRSPKRYEDKVLLHS